MPGPQTQLTTICNESSQVEPTLFSTPDGASSQAD